MKKLTGILAGLSLLFVIVGVLYGYLYGYIVHGGIGLVLRSPSTQHTTNVSLNNRSAEPIIIRNKQISLSCGRNR
jgi:hypothetical protein